MSGRLLAPTPDILIAYDDLRRRENQMLVRLLDTLPRVDDLPAEMMDQARDAVFHTDYPFLLALVGPFGVGKSSLINALLGQDVLATGPVPTTERVMALRYGDSLERIAGQDGLETVFYPSPLLKLISLVDTPGVESVFDEHSRRTESFLHRSDWVVLVMLATQALSAGNLAFLQALSRYGKRVLIVVNQVDLLDDAQRDTVRQFVQEQCLLHLGQEPKVFLVSARRALAARQADPPDQAAWQASGMADLESFLLDALDDRERLRQKLQTPLQIAHNVLTAAQKAVQDQQQALDQHRRVQENIAAQIAAGQGQQREQVNAVLDTVAAAFAESAQRGEDAIRDLFQPGRAVGQILSGISELLGLAGLARRLGARSRAEAAFAAYAVFEPLEEIAGSVNDLGPWMEGRDLQDMDDLVLYTNRALEELPESLRAKVIGEVRAPASYNREPLRRARPDLDAILGDARRVEIGRLDGEVRTSLAILGGWELAVVLAIMLLGVLAVDWSDAAVPLVLVLGALALMFLGVGVFIFRGGRLARRFSDRLLAHSQQYQAALRQAAEDQIQEGVTQRQDVAAPFVRLISAQTALQASLAADLRRLEEELAAFAGEIGGPWERKTV